MDTKHDTVLEVEFFNDQTQDQPETKTSCKSNQKQVDKFIKNLTAYNYEVSINGFKLSNPVEMLERFYPIKYDENLSNQEKIKQVEKIVKEYMR